MFTLNAKLKADSIFVKAFKLSDLLLMNDNRFPWFILVPRRENISELFELKIEDQQRLWKEIITISDWAKKHFAADKMNVAALGNVVSQLHVHIVCRKIGDPAWPKPVWGQGEPIPYSRSSVELSIESSIQSLLKDMKLNSLDI